MKTFTTIALAALFASNLSSAVKAEFLPTESPTGNTYYISPTGDDSSSGLAATNAWQTWPRALSSLSPGDTLEVMPGIWSNGSCSPNDENCLGGTEMPNIDCDTINNVNGTPILPITIRAFKERASFLYSASGSYGLRMNNCKYYNIEGLRARSQDVLYDSDNDGEDDHQPFSVFDINQSHFINFKRLLLSHNNRYRNTHLLAITSSSHINVEESEFYDFHRHGISVSSGSSFITTKRNFLHARLRVDLPPPSGNKSHTPDMGDEYITFYATDNNISQNDIGFNCEGIQSTGKNNKILGGIVMDGKFGFAVSSNCRNKGDDQLCTDDIEKKIAADNLFENGVSVDNATGAECKSANNCQFKNMTVVNAENWAYVMRDSIGTSSGDGELAGRFNPTLRLTRSIALQSDDHEHTRSESGFVFAELDDSAECDAKDDTDPDCERDKVSELADNNYLWLGLDLFAWNFQPGIITNEGAHFSYSADPSFEHGNARNNVITNPEMGQCYLDLNEQLSPVGALSTASEIGANALYAYENGVMTKTRLFNEQTNQFIGCGEVVEGVNDGPNSCTTLPTSKYGETFNISGCGYYAQ